MWYFRYYLVALVLLVSLRKSAITWTERLLIVFFLNAALTHIRHVGLMLMALTPFIARMIDRHLSDWFRTKFESKEKRQIQLSSKSGPLAAADVMLVLLLAGSINHRALMFLTPEKLVEVETGQLNQLVGYLEDNLPDGNMFNEYALGGYLLYALTPPPKVFIDGRADMYGEQIMSDYNKILSSSSEREKLLDKYDIGWIVFEKDSDLVRGLKDSGHWQTTFANENYAVVTRADTGKAAQVDVD
jgi:hypothetical protein